MAECVAAMGDVSSIYQCLFCNAKCSQHRPAPMKTQRTQLLISHRQSAIVLSQSRYSIRIGSPKTPALPVFLYVTMTWCSGRTKPQAASFAAFDTLLVNSNLMGVAV